MGFQQPMTEGGSSGFAALTTVSLPNTAEASSPDNAPVLFFDRRDRLYRRFSLAPVGYISSEQYASRDEP
jgi:hypothetical protein